MEQYDMIELQSHPELTGEAAAWFSSKWNIPKEAYLESMEESLKKRSAVPRWYVVMAEGRIIGGLGVIANDFHDRRDLTPNVCAVYVEENWRGRGIAGRMLRHVCGEMKKSGVDTLYLLTNHTSFYERYGWEFLCMVQGDGEPEMSRMYVHREE